MRQLEPRMGSPDRTVRTWSPYRAAPRNLLVIDCCEREEELIKNQLRKNDIDVLEINADVFSGIDADDIGSRALFIHNLDQCPQHHRDGMRALLNDCLIHDRLVVATSNHDLAEWDDHKSLLEIFPEAEHLFAGERAVTARDIWNTTVEDNPKLKEFLYKEAKHIHDHQEFERSPNKVFF